jgi:SAM-dependent methyltransferase
VSDPDWRRLNLASWEERTAVHLGPRGYDLAPHRAGRGRLDPLAAAALGDVTGARVCHLQCHIGDDSVAIAQAGAAEVLGLDFSPAAIAAAQALAAECGAAACRFALADAQACAEALPEEAGRFDLAFASWGTITWLPDLGAWARSLAHVLRPGGTLAFVDAHPAALVFDGWEAGHPRWTFPYFARAALPFDSGEDYADPAARLANRRTIEFLHPLEDILGALRAAGFRLDALREHDRLAWALFPGLIRAEDGYWTWPDRSWLPLALTIRATRE